jgi:hypothetical protein
MALQPTFTLKPSCNYDQLIFQETTGTYDASSNLGGYGSPNATLASVTATKLVITDELNSVVFDDITTISESETLGITYISLTELEVSGVDKYTTALTDGLFSAVYTVTAGGIDYTYTVKILVLPDTWCKLNKAMIKMIDPSCGCVNADFKDKWLEGFSRLMALEGDAICGDLTYLTQTHSKLNTFFDNLNCNC